jgi:hypothetical protein
MENIEDGVEDGVEDDQMSSARGRRKQSTPTRSMEEIEPRQEIRK